MERNYFRLARRVLDEPVASSSQVKQQQMVKLAPVHEMHSLVVIVILQES